MTACTQTGKSTLRLRLSYEEVNMNHPFVVKESRRSGMLEKLSTRNSALTRGRAQVRRKVEGKRDD